MSGFGLAQVKAEGTTLIVDPGNTEPHGPVVKTTWFEFDIEDERIQEVVDHLKKIGIDCDPRRF